MTAAAPSPHPQAVRVRAPARLHLGFIDLGGSLGRRFGGLGLALDHPETRVRIARAAQDSARGPDSARAAAALRRVREVLGLGGAYALEVESALPAHGGLGSGTQLALATAIALARVCGHPATARDMARLLGRGQRSAIGLGAFETGGAILDGGKPAPASAAEALEPPPVIAHLCVPADWRFLLICDRHRAGLSGEAENRAMEALPPFPAELAARISHLVLMQALPALAEGDAQRFGLAVGEMQRRLGDHYAAVQGGTRFTSPDVADAIAFLEAEGLAGVGQSSWGPTGFAVIGQPDTAEALLQALRSRYADRTNLSFDCVRGNNRGARIEDL